jgi:NAD(P)-dependent dehydrogenase (short-subunit alcohol dehydrogenase family)
MTNSAGDAALQALNQQAEALSNQVTTDLVDTLLIRDLAAANGVTANAVAPGFTRKDATGHSALDPAQWAAVVSRIPLGRLGTPDDIGNAVVFMASDASSWVTGQCLYVTGGL